MPLPKRQPESLEVAPVSAGAHSADTNHNHHAKIIMIWHKHKSFGDYLPPTHESYPYVIRRENRDRIILEVNPGPIKLGRYDSVGAAKSAAMNHNKSKSK